MALYDYIGLAGTLCILAGYFLLQLEWVSSRSLFYSLLNLVGAAALLYSLCFAWNLAAVVIEGVWLVISLVGVARWLHFRRVARESTRGAREAGPGIS